MSEHTLKNSAADLSVDAFQPFRNGIRHVRFLASLAKVVGARSYFEIGTSKGNSLAAMECACVSVDPNYRIEQNVIGSKPSLFLFQTTSDDFFARYNLCDFFPENGVVDLAFLDGMHHFEYLLRDFINTEKYCDARSLIVLHDCLPLRPISARRLEKGRHIATDTQRPVMNAGGGWTGDVWKVLRILQEVRPDLHIAVFDCPPSSLVIVSNCNPASRELSDRYDELVARWMPADQAPGWFDDLHDSVTLLASRDHANPHSLLSALGIPQRGP